MIRNLLFGAFVFVCISSTASSAQQLWGTTSAGGSNNLGVVFSADPNGTAVSTLKQFTYTTTVKEATPQSTGLLKASNGNFYGMTQGGGGGLGALFEYNLSNGTYTKLHDFAGAPSDGSYPVGTVVQTSNAKLYGMTTRGGSSDQGIIFEYDITSKAYTKKIDFDGTTGNSPQGSLIAATNGKLYGTTASGGSSGNGTVFEFDPASGTITKRANFDYSTLGGAPWGDFVQTADGKLYTMTSVGGSGDGGTIVLFDPVAGTIAVKANLTTATGYNPYGSLTLASNGKLYALNAYGGTAEYGTLIEFDPTTSSFTKKYDFTAGSGSYPYGSLALATATGKLYGLTTRGGTNDVGVIFEYNPATNAFTKKIDLATSLGNSANYGAMLLSGGKFYGMLPAGGANNTGVIFEYDPATNQYTKKFDFGSAGDGQFPPGELTIGPDNKIYGVTENGGANNNGVIYQIDPGTNVFTKKANFSSATGTLPIGRMIAAGNKFYGTTFYGGVKNAGTIYEYDIASATITKKFDFDFDVSGGEPYSGLTKGPNGKLYGVTSSGGAAYGGTLFEFDPSTGATVLKVTFDLTTIRSSQAGLILAPNNKLYGVGSGGANSRGGIFEYDPLTGVYATKVSFSSVAPAPNFPRATLALASNGKLYGVTAQGGANGSGCIFEYDPGTTTVTTKYSFPANVSSFLAIYSGLIQSSNNKLYGMTNNGGTKGHGSIFEFDPATSTFTTQFSFSGPDGDQPWRGSLTLIPSSLVTGDIISIAPTQVIVYPNPASEKVLLEIKGLDGEKRISILNMNGQELDALITSENEANFAIASHAPGIYFVKIVAGQKCYVEKFIKR